MKDQYHFYRLESVIRFHEDGTASMVYKECKPEFKSRDCTNRPSIAEISFSSRNLGLMIIYIKLLSISRSI